MRDAFIDELLTAARENADIMLVVGDLGYGVVDQFAEELPQQFLNAGVAEQNMVGVAAGLALEGYRVFVYSIANFPTIRSLEQVRNDVCYHNLPVTIVSVGAGMAYGTLGYTHFAVEDIAVMRSLPNIRVLSPADPHEARLCVHETLRSPTPAYVRLGKNGEPLLHHEAFATRLGEPIILRTGGDVVLAATGSIVGSCLAASTNLESRGVNATVLSCPAVWPLATTWLSSLPQGSTIFTVEEHSGPGGFGSAVLEAVNDLGLTHRVVRLFLNQEWLCVTGSAEHLRSLHGLDPDSIAEAVVASVS